MGEHLVSFWLKHMRRFLGFARNLGLSIGKKPFLICASRCSCFLPWHVLVRMNKLGLECGWRS